MAWKARISLFVLAASAVTCLPVRADFLPISQPRSSYVTGTTLLDFTGPDSTLIGSLSGGGETLTYSTTLDVRTVPITWSTWGAPPATESATPRVGYTDGISTLTITLSKAAGTFGFELEPDFPLAERTTAVFYSKSSPVGTITLSPNGVSGALLFAASSTFDPISRVVITNLEGDGFAIGRQRFALATVLPTPEPATMGLLFSALLAGLIFLRKNR